MRGLLPLVWTIDHQPVDVSGWRCNAVLNRGYDQMSGRIRAQTYRRHSSSIAQGAVITAYDPSGAVRWEGTLLAPGMIQNGTLAIQGVGHAQRFVDAYGRLLYETRDYSLFTPMDADPYGYKTSLPPSTIARAGQLHWTVPQNETYNTQNHYGAAAWFPGDPISRVAYHLDMNLGMGDWAIEIQTGSGPSGTLSLRHSLALSGTLSYDVDASFAAGDDDLIVIQLKRTGSPTTPGAGRDLVLTQLRVNGIATSDEMFTSDIGKDMAARLGCDGSGILPSIVNALPFDLASGASWADAGMSYLFGLHDWYWRVLDDRGAGPLVQAGPWTKSWTVHRALDAEPQLDALDVYNRVAIRYTTTAGAPASYSLDATPDPFVGTPMQGRRNEWAVDLSDPQPDSSLPGSVASYLLPRLSAQRFSGHVRIIGAVDDSGMGDARAVLPGDLITLADWGPMESRQLRVHETDMEEGQPVHCGIEAPVSASGLIALSGLVLARSA